MAPHQGSIPMKGLINQQGVEWRILRHKRMTRGPWSVAGFGLESRRDHWPPKGEGS